ncbi:MAG: hypothetical protein UU63_C0006G0002 [Candidatus Uhrbacteria bacterium GW2011_GWF2_41_430]|nr:MAG: hypothetical protein UU63_C0006G0002 [Candidatus Uhrbacteria bacterium GW2011_GWF2_41_430]
MKFDSMIISLYASNIGKSNKILSGYIPADKINISVIEINSINCQSFYTNFSEDFEEITLELKDSDGFSIGEFTFSKYGSIQWRLNCNSLTDQQFDFMLNAVWLRYGLDVCIQVDKPTIEEIKGNMRITDGTIVAAHIAYPIIENAKKVAYDTEGLNQTVRARRILEGYTEADDDQV